MKKKVLVVAAPLALGALVFVLASQERTRSLAGFFSSGETKIGKGNRSFSSAEYTSEELNDRKQSDKNSHEDNTSPKTKKFEYDDEQLELSPTDSEIGTNRGLTNSTTNDKDVTRSKEDFDRQVSNLLLLASENPDLVNLLEAFLVMPDEFRNTRDLALKVGKVEARYSPETEGLLKRLDLDDEKSAALLDVSIRAEQTNYLVHNAIGAAMVDLVNSDEGLRRLESDIQAIGEGTAGHPASVLQLAELYYSDWSADGAYPPFNVPSSDYQYALDDEFFLTELAEVVGEENYESLQLALEDFNQVYKERNSFDSSVTDALILGLSDEERLENFISTTRENSDNE